MDGVLYEMIFKRKSFHLFRNVGDEKISENEQEEVLAAWSTFTPLDPSVRTAVRIVPAAETNCRRGEELCVFMYSEQKGNYLQNIGYLGEQLDLWLVSRNIGTLWFGIGKTQEKELDGLSFVIMMGIAKVDDPAKFRKDMFKSKRKPVSDFWTGDPIEGVTDIVRFAPSACNTQPWQVEAADGELKIYRYLKAGKRGIMPAALVSYFNRIDIGIFQCFLDLCLQQKGISFQKELFPDDGSDREKTLNAVYKL